MTDKEIFEAAAELYKLHLENCFKLKTADNKADALAILEMASIMTIVSNICTKMYMSDTTRTEETAKVFKLIEKHVDFGIREMNLGNAKKVEL